MNQKMRADHIVQDLMKVAPGHWQKHSEEGQEFFVLEGLYAKVAYFSESLLDENAPFAWRDNAMEVYRARLGDHPVAIEIFDQDSNCVCLLRLRSRDQIEVVEYTHGQWETEAFGLLPADDRYRPVTH